MQFKVILCFLIIQTVSFFIRLLPYTKSHWQRLALHLKIKSNHFNIQRSFFFFFSYTIPLFVLLLVVSAPLLSSSSCSLVRPKTEMARCISPHVNHPYVQKIEIRQRGYHTIGKTTSWGNWLISRFHIFLPLTKLGLCQAPPRPIIWSTNSFCLSCPTHRHPSPFDGNVLWLD